MYDREGGGYARGHSAPVPVVREPSRPVPAIPDVAWARLERFGIKRTDSFDEFWKSVVRSTADYKGFGAQTGGGYGHLVPPAQK